MNLKNKNLLKDKAYINGAWVGGTKTFAVMDPADEKEFARVPDMSAEDARAAIEAAAKAMPAWAAKTAKERGVILKKWADLMMAHVDDLALIMTTEQGKPLEESK